MQEFELIHRFFKQQATKANGVLLGIGDDCALLKTPENKVLALSVDTVVEGTHFFKGTEPKYIASRALGSAISDLAAMGASPLWFTVSLTMPHSDELWLSSFCEGLFKCASDYHCALVGGDTTRGPLAVCIHVTGSVDSVAMTRSSALVGDKIFVSGSLGDAAAALAILQGEAVVNACHYDFLFDRFYRPQARVELGKKLVGIANAAIDISDGLLADLTHVCVASNVAADIHQEYLPLSDALRDAERSDADQWALTGGDDYELCFTVPPCKLEKLTVHLDELNVGITEIGTIVSGKPQVEVYDKGQKQPVSKLGYSHFHAGAAND